MQKPFGIKDEYETVLTFVRGKMQGPLGYEYENRILL